MSIWNTLNALFEKKETPFVFRDEWIAYLQRNLPIYERLPEDLRERLHEKIGDMIRTTFFEGCGGLDLDDEIILTVAAQACILVVNHEGEPYPRLNTVLLYPSAFVSKNSSAGPGGTIIEREVKCLGESWENGTVILSWNSVKHGADNIFDGHNVSFHEFAHQLDSLDGDTDGVPLLSNEEAYQTWANVLAAHAEQLISDIRRGKKSLLDAYGATNPGEFFAVATEAFLEKPRQMKKKQPELYAELKSFYLLDPADWF